MIYVANLMKRSTLCSQMNVKTHVNYYSLCGAAFTVSGAALRHVHNLACM